MNKNINDVEETETETETETSAKKNTKKVQNTLLVVAVVATYIAGILWLSDLNKK